MTEHKLAVFVLIFGVVCWQVLYTVGLVWKAAPDEVVNVQQGSNITLKWHYEMEDSETFLYSEFVPKDRKFDVLASRYKDESYYNHMSFKKKKFAVSGKNNVILTLFSAELGSSNSGYCCTVEWDSKKGRNREERCATLSFYDPPRITSHTPQLSCKQGDQVKLQCNATGYPEPRVRWIHRDTKQIIGNSFVTSLNITGKRSEGGYCCDVRNRFGRETTCTTVKVTEYKPVKTILVHWVSNNMLHITCNAIASPPLNYFLIRINEEQHNLTNVVNTFRYISTQNNTVSCIPFNKYGQGPVEKINLPGYVSPKFTREIITQYTMTDRKIKLACSATGTPKPNITWTKENTEDVVSTEEHYEVPHVKCANKTLTFYCHASNVIGSIRSKEIQVQVMTQRNCTSNSDRKIIPKEKKLPLIVGTSCGILMAICLTVAVFIYLKKRKGITSQDKKPTDGGPYAAPLDAVVPSAEVQLPKRDTLPDDGYSNLEKVGFPNTIKSQRPKKEESQYETLLA